MAASSSRKLRRFVIGFWAFNLCLGLLVTAAWLWKNPAARALIISPTPIPTGTDPPTATASFVPTATFTLTATAVPSDTPTPTLTPTPTSTPIPFSEGPIVIGTSVEGRPLEVYRFGTGATERLIVAGMHGGAEYNTIQLADELIAYLGDHPEIVPPEVTLYILRALNPDGAARSHDYLGRTNANLVDLNRNWPANWQKSWNPTGCWTLTYVSAGSGPASEPETQALMAFIQAHHFDGLINYHSAALGIFPGGIPISEASKRLAEAVAAVSTYPYPPINTGCEYTGGMVDWTANQGIPSLDVELTDHTDTDFEMNLKVLQVFLNWKQ